MQNFFILIACTGFAYFCLTKRYFDFFSLGFFSAIVYFLPGFFGYVLRPTKIVGYNALEPIVDEAYLVMISVLFFIIIGAFIYDYLVKKPPFKEIYLRGTSYAPLVIVAIACVGLFLTHINAGDALFSPNKHKTIEALNRWFLVWSRGATLATVICFCHKKWGLFSISLVLLLFNVYVGFRSSFAIAMLSLITIWLFNQGEMRLSGINNIRKYWQQFLGVMFLLYFIFLYKKLYILVKVGNWEYVWALISDPNTYVRAINESEPFFTQTVLNEIIRQDFRVGLNHILGNIASQLVIFSSMLKIEGFNEKFQPTLFAYRDAGLANNIWAEMWSAGGWLLLLIFIAIFVILLGVGSNLLRSRNPTLLAGSSVLFSYWAFYIHRNDIRSQLSFEKQLLLMLIFVIILCYCIPMKKRRKAFFRSDGDLT